MRSPISLLAGCILLFATAAPLTPASASLRRPSLFKIPLEAQSFAPSAKGVAELRPARSPFSMAVTPDGNFIFEAEVSATGLPAPSALGPYTTHAVWAVNSDLSEVRFLGILKGDQPVKGKVAFSKFIIFITAEGASPGAKWKGPVLMRGFSPSNYLENFGSKTLMNGGQIPPQ